MVELAIQLYFKAVIKHTHQRGFGYFLALRWFGASAETSLTSVCNENG